MSILINENERYISNCEFKIESVSDRNFEFNINDFVNFILNNYWKIHISERGKQKYLEF